MYICTHTDTNTHGWCSIRTDLVDLCRGGFQAEHQVRGKAFVHEPGPGFRVQGSGFRGQGGGFGVWGLGFEVQGLGFRVWGSGFAV